MVKELTKHRSFTDETLLSNYFELLQYVKPDQQALLTLRNLCNTEDRIRKMLYYFNAENRVWWRRYYRTDVNTLIKLVQTHKPTQQLVNEFLTSIKEVSAFN